MEKNLANIAATGASRFMHKYKCESGSTIINANLVPSITRGQQQINREVYFHRNFMLRPLLVAD